MVVLYVVSFCYTDNHKFPNVEVQKLLNDLNKPHVKSIESPDGDIIDCVHVFDQPAFDHPLLKNHTIKMKPDYHPDSINMDYSKVSFVRTNDSTDEGSSLSISQLWHSNGECPKGTIPIRRTKKEDILRATSIKSYGKKKSFFFGQPSSIKPQTEGHEYATASTRGGQFYGTKAIFNVWNPKVQENEEFSLAQTWLAAGSYVDSSINTIEAGWQVCPVIYGDHRTRLFIYWTSDAYKKTGCYNLDCPGFVQTSNKYVIGGSLSGISQMYGIQYELTIQIWKGGANGDWWMQVNGENIGYWPSSLFKGLRRSAQNIQWGGEVVNSRKLGLHTTTQMGSGQFPGQGYGRASYVRNILTLDRPNAPFTTPKDVNTDHQPNCYDILTASDNNWGRFFYFGGPGRNGLCR
ncbi:hypothetical protein R6Q59_012017 [Mikania micrantha]